MITLIHPLCTHEKTKNTLDGWERPGELINAANFIWSRFDGVYGRCRRRKAVSPRQATFFLGEGVYPLSCTPLFSKGAYPCFSNDMKRSSLPAKSSLSLSVNVLGGCTPFCHVPSIIGVPLPAMCPCCYYGCTPFLPCALIIMVVSFFVMFPCKDGCAPLSCALIIGGVPPFMMRLYYYGCTPFSCALIIVGVPLCVMSP